MIKNLSIAALVVFLVLILTSNKITDNTNYFVVHYTTGKNWNKKLQFESQPYSAAHSRFLSTLKKHGKIVFGMRYSDKGMICFKAKDLTEIKDLINSDTAVLKQIFTVDVQEADVFYDGCLTAEKDTVERKVRGIGGIFFKAQNVKNLNQWYYKNLGIVPNEYGTLFEFRSATDPNQKNYLQWSPFNEKTKYFEPSQKQFMINYRVQDLKKLKTELEKNSVQILDTIESYEYGKFLHIMDPEGNKIELWEAVDTEFTRLYNGKTNK